MAYGEPGCYSQDTYTFDMLMGATEAERDKYSTSWRPRSPEFRVRL